MDDILDGDGYVVTQGVDGARRLADEAADRARGRLDAIGADTSVLREIVDDLAVTDRVTEGAAQKRKLGCR